MAQLIGNEELPNNGSVQKFEGYHYGDVDVSFFFCWIHESTKNLERPYVRGCVRVCTTVY